MPAKPKKHPPIHPGESLGDILIEAGISAAAAALKMRIPANGQEWLDNGMSS